VAGPVQAGQVLVTGMPVRKWWRELTGCSLRL